MDITKLDSNFLKVRIKAPDVVWKNALEEPFSLHGIFYDEQEKWYRRMPRNIAKEVSFGVEFLSGNTAGGRLRFKTDSPYVAIRAEVYSCKPTSNLGVTSMTAFSVYVNNQFHGFKGPDNDEVQAAKGETFSFEEMFHRRDKGLGNIDVYFPSYNSVKALYIGIKEGASLYPADEYPNKIPVVFYGSSITQGGCASHSGNDYVSMLSRWLGFEYINLGFSGNAKGEQKMAEYIASLDMRAFVYDYDHNAPNIEHLQATHAPMYAIIREKHPYLPIIIVSKPDFAYNREANAKRREIIYNTYIKAKERGENVAFVDGETMFGDEWELCTVDCCHPNDFGFYKMAKAIAPILAGKIR